MRALIILFSLIFINSCTSLSKEECASQDWFKLGKKNALNGNHEPNVQKYEKNCAEFKITIESEKYIQGFDHGLSEYCSDEKAYELGENGSTKHGMCEEKNDKFGKYYRKGYKKYVLKKKKKEEFDKTKAELLRQHGNKECHSDDSCSKQGKCHYNKCVQSGKGCGFDSDCIREGICTEVSSFTEYNEFVQVNVCKFRSY